MIHSMLYVSLCLLYCLALSRCGAGDLQARLYPDQSLPPPVYVNLNKLASAAQRKFSMISTPTSPCRLSSLAGHEHQLGDGDNLSVVSAPQTKLPQQHQQQMRHPDSLEQQQTATSTGVLSMPMALGSLPTSGRRHFSTTASNSSASGRPREDSFGGLEDPFSVEMDELDRMVTGECARLFERPLIKPNHVEHKRYASLFEMCLGCFKESFFQMATRAICCHLLFLDADVTAVKFPAGLLFWKIPRGDKCARTPLPLSSFSTILY